MLKDPEIIMMVQNPEILDKILLVLENRFGSQAKITSVTDEDLSQENVELLSLLSKKSYFYVELNNKDETDIIN